MCNFFYRISPVPIHFIYISILLFKSYKPVTFRTYYSNKCPGNLGDAENLRKDLKEGLVMEFSLLKIKK